MDVATDCEVAFIRLNGLSRLQRTTIIADSTNNIGVYEVQARTLLVLDCLNRRMRKHVANNTVNLNLLRLGEDMQRLEEVPVAEFLEQIDGSSVYVSSIVVATYVPRVDDTVVLTEEGQQL